MKYELAKMLFPDHSNLFPGYWGIVSELINKGECLSTIYAMDINYGNINEFVSISKSVTFIDVIVITLDRESMFKSDYYKEAKNVKVKEVKADIIKAEGTLSRLKDLLRQYEEME